MKAIRIGAAVVTIVAMFGMTGSVSATAPQPVTITVVDTGQADPFTASGGPICAAGNVFNASVLFVGWQSGSHARILIVKRFVCPDGTFDILLRVDLDFETGDTVATWSVTDGTGAYASLHGAGSLTGDKTDPDALSILDVYTGGMHID